MLSRMWSLSTAFGLEEVLTADDAYPRVATFTLAGLSTLPLSM